MVGPHCKKLSSYTFNGNGEPRQTRAIHLYEWPPGITLLQVAAYSMIQLMTAREFRDTAKTFYEIEFTGTRRKLPALEQILGEAARQIREEGNQWEPKPVRSLSQRS
jgi:hypothetical protein